MDDDIINHKMDVETIKVSTVTGKINMDIENFRKKVSRENENIIKQKVYQDIAIWDVKEKLEQEKRSRDKLQHDLIELQMQYETISGKYQDELRLRADTLNKVNKNQKIFEILEEYEKVLGNTFKLCETDKATFCKAYQDAAENVRDLTIKYQHEKEKDRQTISNLQNNVAVAGEQEQRVLQLFNKEQSNNSALRTDIKELQQQLNEQAVEANNILMQQDTEIKKTKEALRNQELNLKTLNDQKISLEKEWNDLIEKNNNLLANISELKKQVQETNIIIENNNSDITDLLKDKQDTLKEINDKENLIATLEQNIRDLKNEKSKMEIEHYVITSDLNKDIEEIDTKYKAARERREITIQDLNKMVEQLELDITNLGDSSVNKEKELMEMIGERDKDLELKASVNTEIISEIKTITEVRESLENKIKVSESNIQELDKDIESKATCIKDLMAELNKELYGRSMLENNIDQLKKEKDETFDQVKKLQNDLRNQEEVWSKKMIQVANTARTEKEIIQAEIQELQNTIENIRLNLVEGDCYDDNAVLPPSPVRLQASSTHRLVENSMNFSTLHEDSSNTVDINPRAFAISRGENISPLGISTIKRRNEAAAKGPRAKVPMQETHGSQGKSRKFFKNKAKATNANKRKA